MKLLSLSRLTQTVFTTLIASLTATVAFGFLSQSFAIDASKQLGNMYVRFCNEATPEDPLGSKTTTLEFAEGEQKELCLNVFNNGSEDIFVKLGYVDGVITNDESRNQACANEGVGRNFGQYVDATREPFTVPAKSNIQVNGTIQFPSGYGGALHGCVTSMILDPNSKDEQTGMFAIQVRKANIINMVLEGDINLGVDFFSPLEEQGYEGINNISNDDTMLIYYEAATQRYVASVGVHNFGTVQQIISLTGTVSNQFGFADTVFTTTKTVSPQSSVIIKEYMDTLPRYKGPFTFDLATSYTPEFTFETDAITDDLKETRTKSLTAGFMIFPLIPVIIIVAILLFLILLIRLATRKKKKYSTIKASRKPIKQAAIKSETKKTTTKKTVKKPVKKTTTKPTTKKPTTKQSSTKKPTKK